MLKISPHAGHIGNEPQYQEYARLGFEQKLARERQTAAEENEAASLFAESWTLLVGLALPVDEPVQRRASRGRPTAIPPC